VEDNENMRKTLKDWLKGVFPNLFIYLVGSGEEAIKLCRQMPFELILMDNGLPGINGIQTTRTILAFQPEMHIIMVTIHDGDDYRRDALAAGVCAFISKHTMQKELLPVMRLFLTNDDFTKRKVK
jgi:two-component system invasion response regulator UvrY